MSAQMTSPASALEKNPYGGTRTARTGEGKSIELSITNHKAWMTERCPQEGYVLLADKQKLNICQAKINTCTLEVPGPLEAHVRFNVGQKKRVYKKYFSK